MRRTLGSKNLNPRALEPLERAFYLRSAEQVAKGLLGCELWVRGQRTIIIETEAYLGLADPASHAYHGKRTERVKSMYLEGGHTYIYLIYGMYTCLDFVAGPLDHPEAVLVRAVYREGDDPRRYAGPGKICRELGITRKDDGLDAADKNSPIQVVKNPSVWRGLRRKYPVTADKRVGITKAVDHPLRFFLSGHPAISVKPRPRC